MTSMFDYDDSINLVFDAKIAGKNLVAAKHEILTKTGEFLFIAHSDRELALRMQMVEEDIEKVAHRRLANVSDSKAKLVRALYEEWQIRHASCEPCKTAYNYNPATTATDAAGNVTHDTNGQTQHGAFQGQGHGTMAGWNAHQSAGTAPCMACAGAKSSYDSRVAEDKAHPPFPTASKKTADQEPAQNAGPGIGKQAVNGFCHGCASELGSMAARALPLLALASKKAGHDVFCDSCKANPSKINCGECKEEKGTTASVKEADGNFGQAVGGFCHGCASAIGGLAAKALPLLALASKGSDHKVFCDSCEANPNKIGCGSCKEEKGTTASTKVAEGLGGIFNNGFAGQGTANAMNGFCHGCGSALGSAVGKALPEMLALASKKPGHDVLCDTCSEHPENNACNNCRAGK